ncbi:glycosyl transferase family 28 [Streptomyces sp. ZEA17I]|uniref:activator-dependent family glycosyltransferase n=1 Tax=Streptomyces sp. ZEA17I TaxID=2202516 RepID=UPI000D6F4BB0|nr:activator-dependent family glycosyltransferase [Streptomyces sp. ZEA17I]PWS39781.1 glycosyl transferase family 28 [Streptomyces sp. ZEA17I]
MRVLFTTFAATSHLHIQIPAAWALRSAGHDVCVASQPDLVEYISHTGLTGVAVGEELRLDEQMDGMTRARGAADAPRAAEDLDFVSLTDLSGTRPERLTHGYLHDAFEALTTYVYPSLSPPSMIDDLVAFARSWRPDLVIWDCQTFAGPVAAMAAGAAHARLLFGLDLIGRSHATFRKSLLERPVSERHDPLEHWLGRTLARHGVAYCEEAVTGQWTIDPIPASMRGPAGGNHVPVRYVPYGGASSIPSWLYEPVKKPRVCVTLGHAGRDVLGDEPAPVAELLEAVADLDIEVIATLDASQLPPGARVPGNVRVVDHVPLDALLPTCAAIVHHGGAGTLQTAQLHGVPQIVFPAPLWDGAAKRSHLETSGSGIAVPDDVPQTAASLRALLTRVLDDPSFARAAAGVRREMLAMPAPRDIVPTLERLTDEHRPQPHRSEP